MKLSRIAKILSLFFVAIFISKTAFALSINPNLIVKAGVYLNDNLNARAGTICDWDNDGKNEVILLFFDYTDRATTYNYITIRAYEYDRANFILDKEIQIWDSASDILANTRIICKYSSYYNSNILYIAYTKGTEKGFIVIFPDGTYNKFAVATDDDSNYMADIDCEDVDNDGKIECIFADTDGPIYYVEEDGTLIASYVVSSWGTFRGAWIIYDSVTGAPYLLTLHAAVDLDADGNVDDTRLEIWSISSTSLGAIAPYKFYNLYFIEHPAVQSNDRKILFLAPKDTVNGVVDTLYKVTVENGNIVVSSFSINSVTSSYSSGTVAYCGDSECLVGLTNWNSGTAYYKLYLYNKLTSSLTLLKEDSTQTTYTLWGGTGEDLDGDRYIDIIFVGGTYNNYIFYYYSAIQSVTLEVKINQPQNNANLYTSLVNLSFTVTNTTATAYDFKVTINNPNSYDLNDYQVRIDLSDYINAPTNLRVTDTNGNVLPFCYEQSNGECNTNPSSIIWVKVNLTANSNTTINIYTEQTTNYAVDGSQVFDFYDDFQTYDTNTWTLEDFYGSGSTYASATAENGQLKLSISDEANRQGVRTTSAVLTKGTIVEAKITSSTTNAIFVAWVSTGNLYENIPVNDNDYSIWKIVGGSGTKVYAGDKQSYPIIVYDILKQDGTIVFGTDKTGDVYSETAEWDTNYYVGVYGYHAGDLYMDWIRVRKYTDQEPTINIEAIPKEGQINTFYEIYVDNNLDTNETINVDNATITISKILEILKEGQHTIEVKVYDPEIDDYVSDSVTISLDLYDENATYDNYTIYNNTKYVDTLQYTIEVRCGALNHNITIDAWNNRTYTITCDNTTKVVVDSFRNANEGQMDTWFKLNAIDSSDSKYFGNDSFIVDLSPPTINYSTLQINDISPSYCILGYCKDILNHSIEYPELVDILNNETTNNTLFYIYIATKYYTLAVNMSNLKNMLDNTNYTYNSTLFGVSGDNIIIRDGFAFIQFVINNGTTIPTTTATPRVSLNLEPKYLIVTQNIPVYKFYASDRKIISGLKVSYTNESGLFFNGQWDIYKTVQYNVKDYESLGQLSTYTINLGNVSSITINITNYPLVTKSFNFIDLPYILANETPTMQLLLPTLDKVKVLRTYVTPENIWVYLYRFLGNRYELIDVKKSEPTLTGEIDWFTIDADYMKFEFYDENGNLLYTYEDLISGNDYKFQVDTQQTQTFNLNFNFTIVEPVVKDAPDSLNETMHWVFTKPVSSIVIYYVTNNTVYKKVIPPPDEYDITLDVANLIPYNDTIRVEFVFVFDDGYRLSFYYISKKALTHVEQFLSTLLENTLLRLLAVAFFMMLTALIVIYWKSEYSHIVLLSAIPTIMAFFGAWSLSFGAIASLWLLLTGVGMVRYGV